MTFHCPAFTELDVELNPVWEFYYRAWRAYQILVFMDWYNVFDDHDPVHLRRIVCGAWSDMLWLSKGEGYSLSFDDFARSNLNGAFGVAVRGFGFE